MTEEFYLPAEKAMVFMSALQKVLDPTGPVLVDAIKIRVDRETITIIPICKQIEIKK